MKEYQKPFIEDEEIEIEDICLVSGGTQSVNIDDGSVKNDPVTNLWN